MLEVLDVSKFALPPDSLLSAVELEGIADGPSELVRRVQERVENTAALQVGWTRDFDRLYDDVAHGDYPAPLLVRCAAFLLERQRAVLEQINPIIEALQQTLRAYSGRPDPEPEVLELAQAIFDLAIGWLSPYQKSCAKLLELAAKKEAASRDMVRARPVKGEIDYGELSREHMARYPKIRAALAE